MKITSVLPSRLRHGRVLAHQKGNLVMAAILIVLGFYLVYPIILVMSFSLNSAREVFAGDPQWGFENWRLAFARPGLVRSLGNSVLIWGLVVGIAFPISVAIAWVLARARIPFSHGLELMFWVSFMMPGIATTLSWITLMDPDIGVLNTMLESLPFVSHGPFNIFSVQGIVFAHVMANGISLKVMLLTPAFRNMDASLEEAGRVSGASGLSTALRVTLPLMVPPMTLVFALQLLRIFQSFEVEQLLGVPIDFFVYSTMIFNLVRSFEPPLYGQAAVLASLTLLVIGVVIPFQRWILQRKHYTTISGSFRPGLADLGSWTPIVFGSMVTLLLFLTVLPVLALILGSFMTRAGFFMLTPVFTLSHWELVLTDNLFFVALRTTLILAAVGAVLSPILFSILAYIIVRTRWRGRGILDSMVWLSGALPGMLAGLGLMLMFLGTPGLSFLYGTIWALLLVIVIQGKTTGVNMFKVSIVQIGSDMEEAAHIAGAGWFKTYLQIWLPLLMPSMILMGILSFVIAANTTAPIILLASRETMTLSILALELASGGIGKREEASIIGLLLMFLTIGLAFGARYYGLRMGVRQSDSRVSRRTSANSVPTV